MMEKEVIECLEKTEQNNDTCMSYVIKHNGLKSKSEEIRNVELLENEIVVLEAKKKELFWTTAWCSYVVLCLFELRWKECSWLCFGHLRFLKALSKSVWLKFLMESNRNVPTHWVCKTQIEHLIAPHCGTFNFICKSCRKCRSDEGLLSSFAASSGDFTYVVWSLKKQIPICLA